MAGGRPDGIGEQPGVRDESLDPPPWPRNKINLVGAMLPGDMSKVLEFRGELCLLS
jgi:hypothetical protein